MLEADFVKSHGLGNDYVVVDAKRFGVDLTPERVRLLCHRHLGLGSDGILEVHTAPTGFTVRIWNPDGSEAERSGNGLRIAAKFLYEHGYTSDRSFVVDTLGGAVQTQVFLDRGRVNAVRLQMGRASIDASTRALDSEGDRLDVTVVSVGNPHCVIFGEPFTRERLFALGPRIENHPAFPDRINVQLAEVESRGRARALIWERGAGHTLASGTSACAVAAAAFERALVDGRLMISMEGGELEVEISPELDLIMTGPVEETYVGFLSTDLRRRLKEIQ